MPVVRGIDPSAVGTIPPAHLQRQFLICAKLEQYDGEKSGANASPGRPPK
jgi:hypothetical protein